MKDKIVFIVNPISGTKDKRQLIGELTLHHEYKVKLTQKAGDATSIAAEAVGRGAKAVIAVGGDGTVRETAIALKDTTVPLGIIPCGSGNGLARHLHIPTNFMQALAVIEGGHVSKCDYASTLSHPFFCTMGVGFDAEVSHVFAESGKRGPLNYVKSVLETFNGYQARHYTLHMPHGSIERKALLVTVANAAQYGNNARIAPDASVADGLLDVTVLLDGFKLYTVEAAIQLFAGRLKSNPLIETYRVPSLTIEREAAGMAHLDGEPLRLPARIPIKIHPSSLRVIIPPGTRI